VISNLQERLPFSLSAFELKQENHIVHIWILFTVGVSVQNNIFYFHFFLYVSDFFYEIKMVVTALERNGGIVKKKIFEKEKYFLKIDLLFFKKVLEYTGMDGEGGSNKPNN